MGFFRLFLLWAGAGTKMLPGLEKNHDEMKEKLDSWRDLDEKTLLERAAVWWTCGGIGRWWEGASSRSGHRTQ